MHKNAHSNQKNHNSPPITSTAATMTSNTSMDSAPGGHLANRSDRMSSGQIMQMQRAIGNKGVMQMLGAAYGNPNNMRPPIATPVAAPVATAVPDAAPVGRTIPNDLSTNKDYKEIYDWFKKKSEENKKQTLFSYFDELEPQQKMAAFDMMAGIQKPDLKDIKSVMKSGILFKSVNWDKFSSVSRVVKNIKTDTTDHTADQARHYVSYAATGSSAAATGVSNAAKQSKELLGATGATSTALNAAPVASGLGGLASLTQVYNATQNYDSSTQNSAENSAAVAEGMGGLGDATRAGADTANTIRLAGGMAVSGAATAVAGAGAIAGGAAYMGGGIRGYLAARRNINKLEKVKKNLADKEKSASTEKIGEAADLATTSQGIKKSSSAATALKGAAMVAGGIALIASASLAGPIVLGAAAAIGGVAALTKFLYSRKKKADFVDKLLNIDEETDKEMDKEENKGKGKKDKIRDEVRQRVLESKGFNSTDQFYTQTVNDLSLALHEAGVKGDDMEAQSVIESIGLKIDKSKATPNKDAIAKKLSI